MVLAARASRSNVNKAGLKSVILYVHVMLLYAKQGRNYGVMIVGPLNVLALQYANLNM